MTRETREELAHLGVATLYEASGLDADLDPAIRPAWPGARVCGPALPVRTGPGDNLALHRAVELARPGQVLVVDGHGAPHGYWGDVLAAAAREAGVAGLVLDGGVRDVGGLAEIGIGTFSRWVCVRRTTKAAPGTIGEPVVVGGRTVSAGDVVVGDADGVVALPAGSLNRILADARAREGKEAGIVQRIRMGASTVDLYGLRAAAASGLENRR